jgi:hypothetical protein
MPLCEFLDIGLNNGKQNNKDSNCSGQVGLHSVLEHGNGSPVRLVACMFWRRGGRLQRNDRLGIVVLGLDMVPVEKVHHSLVVKRAELIFLQTKQQPHVLDAPIKRVFAIML